MHAVALAAGKRADFFLLVAALEIEGRDVSSTRHVLLAEGDDVIAAGDFFPHGLFAVERVAALVDITELHRLADLHRAAVGFFLAGNHAEQRRLARAVRADHADDAAG